MGKAVDSAFATVKDVVLMAFDGGSKNTKYMDLISEGLSMLLNADSSQLIYYCFNKNVYFDFN